MPNQTTRIEETRRRWWTRPWPWIGVAVVVLGGAGFTVVGHRTKSSDSAVTVRWTTVTRGNVVNTVSLSGTLTPAHEATITATGTLTSVSVHVGDKVKKGQVIAHVDDTSYQNQLAQAEAQLNEAKAKLAQTEEVTTTTNNRGQTQTQQPDPNAVAQAQAGVDAALATVNQIEDEIAACTLKSPISGTVLQAATVNGNSVTNGASGSGSSSGTSAQSGNSGTSGNPVAVIANLDANQFLVSANVAQADVAKLKKGQDASISLSTSGPSLGGKVESIGYQPQTQNGVTLYPVTIQVSAPKDGSVHLFPGESASVTVAVESRKNVLTLPTAAIVSVRGQTGVYVQSSQNADSQPTNSGSRANGAGAWPGQQVPDGLTFVPVQVGLYGGNTVEIRSGLKQGEQVAIVTVNSAQNQGASTNSGMGALMGGYGGRFQGGFPGGLNGSGLNGARAAFRGAYGGSAGGFGSGSDRGFGGGSSTGFSGGFEGSRASGGASGGGR
ncbi:MAG: HlyD family efflux transporter periplasmic adaptor subunit [Alicyclobacillus herbarius]|uniref:efflux RND transporter periplasmic adaptor subunit n=1 Tax=Alicyclobacillus herbarius TaxID=122960 RepID=UPI0023537D47|nr:HlyD family efflux transporter periplasmic adaptor subunit [Alicyclobacillus herbarius]MCL6631453.1 HlyD family efflux transporter periplasmic adaptor subunit [Alicyclobacillus herbarius]